MADEGKEMQILPKSGKNDKKATYPKGKIEKIYLPKQIVPMCLNLDTFKV